MANLKDELNQIVTELNKITPSALSPDDPVTDTNWNKVVNSITKLTEAISKINSISPDLPLIGYKYFRFPGEKLPWDLYPATKPTDWLLLDEKYPGVALRLSGGNASKFKEDSTTVSYDEKAKIEIPNPDPSKPPIKKPGEGGAQMDALQTHTHRYTKNGFEKTRDGNNNYVGSSQHNIQHPLTEPPSGRHDIETRMINITVQTYEYRADLNNH